MLGFRLVLKVVHLPNVSLLLLIAFDTAVDVGRRTGRLIEQ